MIALVLASLVAASDVDDSRAVYVSGGAAIGFVVGAGTVGGALAAGGWWNLTHCPPTSIGCGEGAAGMLFAAPVYGLAAGVVGAFAGGVIGALVADDVEAAAQPYDEE